MEAQQHSDQNETNHPEKGVDRRKFIRYSAGAGVGLIALAASGKRLSRVFENPAAQATGATPSTLESSRVAIARSDNLFSHGNGPEKERLKKMLDAAMESVLGIEDSGQQWRTLFSADDIVGIKVNCIAGPQLSSHPNVVDAIVSKLQAISIPAENIIIWDRKGRELTNAGYTLNTDGPGVRCYGTDEVGYERNASTKATFNGCLSKILTERITALINVPILKTHGGAGVSLAMKNHYGSFNNPGRHHGNMCDPYIADLNSLDELKDKTRLIVCDATRGLYNGGPGHNAAFTWQYSGLVVSKDPVALDTVCTGIIDDRRAEAGLPSLKEAGKYPRQLASAAERGVGNTEKSKIAVATLAV